MIMDGFSRLAENIAVVPISFYFPLFVLQSYRTTIMSHSSQLSITARQSCFGYLHDRKGFGIVTRPPNQRPVQAPAASPPTASEDQPRPTAPAHPNTELDVEAPEPGAATP